MQVLTSNILRSSQGFMRVPVSFFRWLHLLLQLLHRSITIITSTRSISISELQFISSKPSSSSTLTLLPPSAGLGLLRLSQLGPASLLVGQVATMLTEDIRRVNRQVWMLALECHPHRLMPNHGQNSEGWIIHRTPAPICLMQHLQLSLKDHPSIRQARLHLHHLSPLPLVVGDSLSRAAILNRAGKSLAVRVTAEKIRSKGSRSDSRRLTQAVVAENQLL